MNYLIPNFIVRDEGCTLINRMLIDNVITEKDSDKILLVFKYFWANTTQSNTINFTLEDMVNGCGFVARVETNQVFKDILSYLHKNNYIIADNIDFLKIKPKQFIRVSANYFDVDDKGNRINYFILDDEEVGDIYKINNVDNNKLLLYYANLKSRIYTKINTEDEKAQVCYVTSEEMSKDILINTNTIHQYNQILVENDLIYYRNAGKFTKINKNKRIYTQSANTYTLTSIKNYKSEVDKSINLYIEYMKKFGWELCDDVSLTKRQVAGTINRLKYLEKQGKLDDKGKEKLKQLQEQQNTISSTAKYNNKKLLEDNPNMLLSDIFLDMNMNNLAEKYQNIELDLGLVDDDFNLLVDWDYYKWIITEYNEDEHDKYRNYVAKKINDSDDVIVVKKTKSFSGNDNMNSMSSTDKLTQKWLDSLKDEEYEKQDGGSALDVFERYRPDDDDEWLDLLS